MISKEKALLNFTFVMWLLSELFLQHTLISQMMLMLFCITIFIVTSAQELKLNTFIVSMLLVTCWSVINIVTGHSIDVTVARSMTVTLFINLLFFFLFSQYYRFIGDINEIMKIFSVVVLFFSIFCMLTGISSVLSSGRMNIDGINANTAAYYAIFANLWSFYLLIFEKKKTIFFIPVYIFFIMMTGSRGAFISVFIGMFLLFIIHNRRYIHIKVIAAVLGVIIVLVMVMKTDVLYSFIGYRLEPLFDYIRNGTYEESSMDSRIKYSELAFSRVDEALIFGHGLDCFRCINGSYGSYSHNNYAEMLFSLGVVGSVLYYFPYIWNLKYYFMSILKEKNKTVAVCIFIVIYLISEPFRVTYFNRAFMIIPLMCYLYMSEQKTKSRRIKNNKINM